MWLVVVIDVTEEFFFIFIFILFLFFFGGEFNKDKKSRFGLWSKVQADLRTHSTIKVAKQSSQEMSRLLYLRPPKMLTSNIYFPKHAPRIRIRRSSDISQWYLVFEISHSLLASMGSTRLGREKTASLC